jgi:hypothetical protein
MKLAGSGFEDTTFKIGKIRSKCEMLVSRERKKLSNCNVKTTRGK